MGRGDNDILFHPPRMKKANKQTSVLFQEEVYSLPGPTKCLFVLGNNTFCHTDDGILHLFDQEIQVGKAWWEELYNVPSDANVISSERALAWADRGGVVIKEFSLERERMILKDPPSSCSTREEVLGGHISNNNLYLLSGSKEKGYITLQSTPLRDSSGWSALSDLSDKHYARIANKGQASLLFYSEYPGRSADNISWDLGTISVLDQIGWSGETFGVGQELEKTIRLSLSPDDANSWANLLTPSDRPGNIWYIRKEEGESSSWKITLCEREMLSDTKRQSFVLENDDAPVKLERFGNQFALLGENTLSLVTISENNKKREQIYRLKKKYTNMRLEPYKIVLWNKGETEYLTVNIRG
jgi:hypothetical protein